MQTRSKIKQSKMSWYYHFQLIFYCAVISAKSISDQKLSELESSVNGPLLLNELLLDYDPYSKPSGQAICSIRVSASPTFVSWKEDMLKVSMTLEQSWMDERLKYTGRKDLKLKEGNGRIWLPDTMFPGLLEDARCMYSLINIQPRGMVQWKQRLLLTLPCPLDPSQIWASDGIVNCTATMTSGGDNNDELEYVWSYNSTLAPTKLGQLTNVYYLYSSDDIAENQTIPVPITVKKQPELKVVFTVQTEMTKDVLRYLIKKATRDL